MRLRSFAVRGWCLRPSRGIAPYQVVARQARLPVVKQIDGSPQGGGIGQTHQRLACWAKQMPS